MVKKIEQDCLHNENEIYFKEHFREFLAECETVNDIIKCNERYNSKLPFPDHTRIIITQVDRNKIQNYLRRLSRNDYYVVDSLKYDYKRPLRVWFRNKDDAMLFKLMCG